MSNRNLALQFIHHFCAGDVDALAQVLAEDLRAQSGVIEQYYLAQGIPASQRSSRICRVRVGACRRPGRPTRLVT